MKTILLLGAGRSASTLIDYLEKQCELNNWQLNIGDANPEMAGKSEGNTNFFELDARNEEQIAFEVAEADLAISMLPASFHNMVAEACLEGNTHLVTASYVTPEMKASG